MMAAHVVSQAAGLPSQGELVSLALVTPPRGMEAGYGPIVIRQEIFVP